MAFKIIFVIIISYLRIITAKKGFSKNDQVLWKIECELGFINDKDCPIDGGWSAWGVWQSCHGLCDDIGHKQRVRECVNPAPSNGGSPCIGPSVQTDTCYLTSCKVDDYRRLVVRDPSRYECFHQLETVPALLERCLQIECPIETIRNSLIHDNTWQHNPDSIWNSLQCVKHNVGCPLPGEWGAWGVWSSCSARCGPGYQWRLRKCDSPPPSTLYLTCEGDALHSKVCEGDQCAIEEHEICKDSEDSWGPWSDWSVCSEKCGIGVKRRKRVCVERRNSYGKDIWGTHCRGPHDELITCVNKECIIDGNWAAWGAWGPCSSSCGVGKRSRVRSCTRPEPSGSGAKCSGAHTEITSCYLEPCNSFTQVVAVLKGDGFINFKFERKRSTLLHLYIRFKALSKHGTLFRRGTKNGSYVRLTLQRWHICVDVSGEDKSCEVSRLCSLNTLTPSSWHSIMLSVTTKVVILQVGNFQQNIIGKFPCNPMLSDTVYDFYIGERFYGEIEEVIVNFIPLNLKVEKKQKSNYIFSPYTVSNVAYEKTTVEESILTFSDDQYLIIPCFENNQEWNLELTVKSSKESCLLIFLQDELNNNWLMISFQNNKIKVKIVVNDFRSESLSSSEYSCNQWIDIYVLKKKNTNAIEVSINKLESLYITLLDEQFRKRRYRQYYIKKTLINNITKQPLINILNHNSYSFCNDEFYIGGMPNKFKDKLHEDVCAFSGIISSVAVNGKLLDLQKYHMERTTNQVTQISSRSASISGSYHEIFWGKSNILNLSCLHTRKGMAAHAAEWYHLDTIMQTQNGGKQMRSIDDGRILRLQTQVNDDFISFYTCRAHDKRKTRNIITYGIVGKYTDFQDEEIITSISVCTTFLLLIITLGWLLIEGVNDLRNGYGFFRDQHLSKKEEAEAICDYIDRNAHLIGSKSFVALAKKRARHTLTRSLQTNIVLEMRRKKELTKLSDDSSSTSEDEKLPVLPELAVETKPSHDIYKCELSFVSSPRHGSHASSAQNFDSSSTFDFPTPRSDLICEARNLKKQNSSVLRRSLRYVNKKHSIKSTSKIHLKMPTIVSSGVLNLSPAQKVLRKFQQLK